MLGDMTTDASVRVGPHTGWRVAPYVARLRYGLLAVFLVVGIGMLVLGARPAPLLELGKALNAGKVTRVTIVGALPPGSIGNARAEIRWHDGVMSRWTQVTQERPDPQGHATQYDSTAPLVTGSIEEHLQAYTEQALTVTHLPRGDGPTWYLAGWQVPAWVGLLGIIATLLSVALLVSGPETLRATKWAWFWAISSPLGPVMLPVCLLVGIPPTGAVEQPYTKHGRLTGGWSFLLFCVLGATVVQNLT